MKSSLVQVRVSDDMKHQVDALFAELGLDTATAVRMFFTQALDHHGIPFPIEIGPNQTTRAAMRQAVERQNMTGPFTSAQAMLTDALSGEE